MKSKKKILNLASWGDLYMTVDIQKCPKCGGRTENLNAFGVVSLSVCKKCKKFYGLVVEDVTSKLNAKFKKENL